MKRFPVGLLGSIWTKSTPKKTTVEQVPHIILVKSLCTNLQRARGLFKLTVSILTRAAHVTNGATSYMYESCLKLISKAPFLF